MEEPSDRMFKTPKKVKKQPVRVKKETPGGEEDCSTGGEEDKTGEEERLLGSSPSPVKEEEPKEEVVSCPLTGVFPWLLVFKPSFSAL